MSRFRLLLVWLIMAAIPLQGLAAASMLFCGPGAHHAPAQVAAAQHGQASHAVEHDHATHAKHSHAAQEQAQAPTADDAGKQLPDASHKCGICASCCHSVAIAEIPQLIAFGPVPHAESAEPFVLIHARPAQVPDKPPRA